MEVDIETPADLVKLYPHDPKKGYGQHFITDPSILEQIAAIGNVGEGDKVLEIGPGCGTLTRTLLGLGASVRAVEIDADSAEFLVDVFGDESDLEVVEGDVLDIPVSKLLEGSREWKCVSNLPYDAATEIFFCLAEAFDRFDRLVLMYQREVAERFVAEPGDDEYGVLSLMGRLYADIQIEKTLPPGAFYPSPRVCSAVLDIVPVDGTRIEGTLARALFKKVVRTAFQKRRKMLRNSLTDLGIEKSTVIDCLQQVDVAPTMRPEKVGFDDFAAMTRALGVHL